MSISATCSGCGKKIAAPDSAAGHKAKCPQCGQVVTFPENPRAVLAAVVKSETPHPAAAEAPPLPAAAAAPTPTPSRTGGPSKHSSATTTVSRLIARTSPYDGLRLMAVILFGVGIAVTVLVFLGSLAALIVVSMYGSPWVAVGVFLGGLLTAAVLLLVARTSSELVRLWADVGDRARHVVHMMEESLNRPGDSGP